MKHITNHDTYTIAYSCNNGKWQNKEWWMEILGYFDTVLNKKCHDIDYCVMLLMATRRQYDCKDKPTAIRHDLHSRWFYTLSVFVCLMVFSATFNNISVIS